MADYYFDEEFSRPYTEEEARYFKTPLSEYDRHTLGERKKVSISDGRIHISYQSQWEPGGEWATCPSSGASLSIQQYAAVLSEVMRALSSKT